jgi:hypothetical protein
MDGFDDGGCGPVTPGRRADHRRTRTRKKRELRGGRLE